MISQSQAFINSFISGRPFRVIQSLANTYLNDPEVDPDKDSLDDIRLVRVFDLLFSKEPDNAVRASLISTFRMLIESYTDCAKYIYDIKGYIKKSYELYCEASQSPPNIDWFSKNFIGSYIPKNDLKESSVNADDSKKTLEPSSEYEIDFYSGEKIPTEQFGFTESQKLETFLKAVYNGLKELDSQNLGLLSFPKEDSKPSWEKNEETGKLIAPTCSEENFVNMFEGVSSKTHPMRTISCARGIHLSAFITAFANPDLKDYKRNERRGDVQRVIKSLVFQPGGKPFTDSSLQKNGSRYDSLLGKYRTIIDEATNKSLTKADKT